MTLRIDFSGDPHMVLDPATVWCPADESFHDSAITKLMLPLLATLRQKDDGTIGRHAALWNGASPRRPARTDWHG
jgi:hypothetical protein